MPPIPGENNAYGGSTMNNQQKTAIVNLKNAGLGNKRVAHQLGINENTVKAYCRRYGIKRADHPVLDPLTGFPVNGCRNCGKILKRIPGRKPRKFCSIQCRTTWWNSHLELVNRKALYNFTCPTCGKAFTAYGDKNRKYCCHPCYITARFGPVRSWEKAKSLSQNDMPIKTV